jgi:protein-tyrosine kinase
LRYSRERERHLITQLDSKSPIAEAFRTLRTNIQFTSIDHEIRSIMITSTGPSEGKSTISSNLSVVMAQSGKKTLLVDTDLRKPTVHHTFRLLNREGLTNVLAGQGSLEKMVIQTEIDQLDILTSGPIPPNPAELLGSKSMSKFMEEASTQYDMVIFDTPPLIAVADAQILASQVDGVLLVLNSGKTNRDMAVKAKSLLNNVKANILGCVINNRKIQGDNYYYYYYGQN